MKLRRSARNIALATALSLSVLAAGCYGKFQLTRMVYDVNSSVEDRYVRSAVTWILVLPYLFAGFVDATVFNVVEFWTGQNPLTVTKVDKAGPDTLATTLSREGKGTVAVLDRFRDGRRIATLVIRDDGRGVVRASLFENGVPAGETVARANADGSVSVERSAGGTAVSGLRTQAELASLRLRVDSVLSRGRRG